MAHANAHYKADFVAAFNKPMLKCVGPRYGDPCGFCVDLTSSDAVRTLEHLHLDHEQDLLITCDMWKRAAPDTPSSWDDGIHRGLLFHLLFGGVCCGSVERVALSAG